MSQADITIIIGDTFEYEVELEDNPSDYTYTATLNSISFATSVSGTTLTLTLNSLQTAALDADNTIYKWRLRRSTADATPEVTTLLHGKATVVRY